MSFFSFSFHVQVISDFILMLRRPGSNPKHASIREIIAIIFSLLLFSLFLKMGINLLKSAFLDIKSTGLERGLELYSKPILFIIIVIAAPILEECAFRLSLRFNPLNLGISVAFISYFVINNLVLAISNFDFSQFLLLRISGPLVLGFIIFRISLYKKHSFEQFWNHYFGWIFYGFVIVFALLHVSNFTITDKQYMFIPVLVLPNLIGGLVFSYIRIRYGFIFALLMHIVNNSIGAMALLLR